MTRLVLILLAIPSLLTACGGEAETAATPTTIVAAFYPLAYAAERIAGDSATVENMTPAGAEPHDVELSARDVERIRDADVVLYLGDGFQPALEEAVAGANGETVDLLADTELISGTAAAEDAEEIDEGDEGERLDPHVWLDPVRFASVAHRIGEVLDRPRAAEALVDELRGLHGELRTGLASCERRQIVTSHAAFGYLADRYDLEQIAIGGLSPEVEPTARELEDVVDEVEETRATTIFFERLVSPRLAQTVARETGAETAVLDPIEGLGAEQLARGENYFTVMRENLAALRKALACR